LQKLSKEVNPQWDGLRLKVHIVVDDSGNILAFTLPPGGTDDRTPVISLSKELIGKVFCDKGYISKDLTSKLIGRVLKLMKTLKKNILMNLFTGIAEYMHQPKKPKLKIETALTRGQFKLSNSG